MGSWEEKWKNEDAILEAGLVKEFAKKVANVNFQWKSIPPVVYDESKPLINKYIPQLDHKNTHISALHKNPEWLVYVVDWYTFSNNFTHWTYAPIKEDEKATEYTPTAGIPYYFELFKSASTTHIDYADLPYCGVLSALDKTWPSDWAKEKRVSWIEHNVQFGDYDIVARAASDSNLAPINPGLKILFGIRASALEELITIKQTFGPEGLSLKNSIITRVDAYEKDLKNIIDVLKFYDKARGATTEHIETKRGEGLGDLNFSKEIEHIESFLSALEQLITETKNSPWHEPCAGRKPDNIIEIGITDDWVVSYVREYCAKETFARGRSTTGGSVSIGKLSCGGVLESRFLNHPPIVMKNFFNNPSVKRPTTVGFISKLHGSNSANNGIASNDLAKILIGSQPNTSLGEFLQTYVYPFNATLNNKKRKTPLEELSEEQASDSAFMMAHLAYLDNSYMYAGDPFMRNLARAISRMKVRPWPNSFDDLYKSILNNTDMQSLINELLRCLNPLDWLEIICQMAISYLGVDKIVHNLMELDRAIGEALFSTTEQGTSFFKKHMDKRTIEIKREYEKLKKKKKNLLSQVGGMKEKISQTSEKIALESLEKELSKINDKIQLVELDMWHLSSIHQFGGEIPIACEEISDKQREDELMGAISSVVDPTLKARICRTIIAYSVEAYEFMMKVFSGQWFKDQESEFKRKMKRMESGKSFKETIDAIGREIVDLLKKIAVQLVATVIMEVVKLLISELIEICNKIKQDLLDKLYPKDKSKTPGQASFKDLLAESPYSTAKDLADGLSDVGVSTLDDLSDTIGTIEDIETLLTPAELCALIKGNPPMHVIILVQNLIKTRYPELYKKLKGKSRILTKEKIISFFSQFEEYANLEFCEDVVDPETNMAFSTQLYQECKPTPDVISMRESLLNGLATEQQIDNLIRKEKIDRLNRIKELVDIATSDDPLGELAEKCGASPNLPPVVEPMGMVNDMVINQIIEPIDPIFKSEIGDFVDKLLGRDSLIHGENRQLPSPSQKPDWSFGKTNKIDMSSDGAKAFMAGLKESSEKPALNNIRHSLMPLSISPADPATMHMIDESGTITNQYNSPWQHVGATADTSTQAGVNGQTYSLNPDNPDNNSAQAVDEAENIELLNYTIIDNSRQKSLIQFQYGISKFRRQRTGYSWKVVHNGWQMSNILSLPIEDGKLSKVGLNSDKNLFLGTSLSPGGPDLTPEQYKTLDLNETFDAEQFTGITPAKNPLANDFTDLFKSAWPEPIGASDELKDLFWKNVTISLNTVAIGLSRNFIFDYESARKEYESVLGSDILFHMPREVFDHEAYALGYNQTKLVPVNSKDIIKSLFKDLEEQTEHPSDEICDPGPDDSVLKVGKVKDYIKKRNEELSCEEKPCVNSGPSNLFTATAEGIVAILARVYAFEAAMRLLPMSLSFRADSVLKHDVLLDFIANQAIVDLTVVDRLAVRKTCSTVHENDHIPDKGNLTYEILDDDGTGVYVEFPPVEALPSIAGKGFVPKFHSHMINAAYEVMKKRINTAEKKGEYLVDPFDETKEFTLSENPYDTDAFKYIIKEQLIAAAQYFQEKAFSTLQAPLEDFHVWFLQQFEHRKELVDDEKTFFDLMPSMKRVITPAGSEWDDVYAFKNRLRKHTIHTQEEEVGDSNADQIAAALGELLGQGDGSESGYIQVVPTNLGLKVNGGGFIIEPYIYVKQKEDFSLTYDISALQGNATALTEIYNAIVEETGSEEDAANAIETAATSSLKIKLPSSFHGIEEGVKLNVKDWSDFFGSPSFLTKLRWSNQVNVPHTEFFDQWRYGLRLVYIVPEHKKELQDVLDKSRQTPEFFAKDPNLIHRDKTYFITEANVIQVKDAIKDIGEAGKFFNKKVKTIVKTDFGDKETWVNAGPNKYFYYDTSTYCVPLIDVSVPVGSLAVANIIPGTDEEAAYEVPISYFTYQDIYQDFPRAELYKKMTQSVEFKKLFIDTINIDNAMLSNAFLIYLQTLDAKEYKSEPKNGMFRDTKTMLRDSFYTVMNAHNHKKRRRNLRDNLNRRPCPQAPYSMMGGLGIATASMVLKILLRTPLSVLKGYVSIVDPLWRVAPYTHAGVMAMLTHWLDPTNWLTQMFDPGAICADGGPKPPNNLIDCEYGGLSSDEKKLRAMMIALQIPAEDQRFILLQNFSCHLMVPYDAGDGSGDLEGMIFGTFKDTELFKELVKRMSDLETLAPVFSILREYIDTIRQIKRRDCRVIKYANDFFAATQEYAQAKVTFDSYQHPTSREEEDWESARTVYQAAIDTFRKEGLILHEEAMAANEEYKVLTGFIKTIVDFDDTGAGSTSDPVRNLGYGLGIFSENIEDYYRANPAELKPLDIVQLENPGDTGLTDLQVFKYVCEEAADLFGFGSDLCGELYEKAKQKSSEAADEDEDKPDVTDQTIKAILLTGI